MRILDKYFDLYIPEEKIASRVRQLGEKISEDYLNKDPIFVSILKGAFIFTSDLMKSMGGEPEVSFYQVSSYQGTKSTGKVEEKIRLDTDLENRHIIVLDDIVDTGLTCEYLKSQFLKFNPASIEFAAFLLKPEVFKGRFPIKYVGFEVENRFLVGYGMDYNEKGRNLSAIYKIRD